MVIAYTFFAIAPLIHHATGYGLKARYDASNFFDDSLALYLPKDEATPLGIARIKNDKVYLGVDTESTTSQEPGEGNGRKSTRLESTQTFDNGLFVADFDHLPSGCGMWPAFWLLHDTGYQEGWYSEFDIVEGVSMNTQNQLTLHTGQTSYLMRDNGGFETTRTGLQCNKDGKGCDVEAPDGTFGSAFDAGNGGIWAAQVEADGIKAWFFATGDEPADLNSRHPDPSSWSTPVMDFVGGEGCSIPDTFKKMNIIINITFCGANAGGDDWLRGCSAITNVDSCTIFVARNPEEFDDVYFAINSVRVFQKDAGDGYPDEPVSATSSAVRTSDYGGWPSMTTEVVSSMDASTANFTTNSSPSATSMANGGNYGSYSPAPESSQVWSWSSARGGVDGCVAPSFGYSILSEPAPTLFFPQASDSTTTLTSTKIVQSTRTVHTTRTADACRVNDQYW